MANKNILSSNQQSSDYTKPLRQLFMEMMALNSVCNEESSEIYFHVFMGAKMKDIMISDGVSNKDLRINYAHIQTSRTGKGRQNKAMRTICSNCGVSCVIITDYSAAGIIGTIDDSAIKFNEKWGLNEVNKQYEKKDKQGNIIATHEWKDPVVKGDAGNYDILIFDELKILLEPKRENEEIMLVLQPGMDCPPYVRKKLRNKTPIEYSNPFSLIGTTFPFKGVNNIMGTSGFLQRMFVSVRVMSIDDIKEMRKAQKTLLTPDAKKNFVRKLQIFKKRIAKINFQPTTLGMTERAKNRLDQISNNFLNQVENLKGINRDASLSFTNTIEEAALKIAGQYVIMHGKSKKIDSTDIQRGYNLIKSFMKNLMEKIDIKEDKDTGHEVKQIIRIFNSEVNRKKVKCLTHTVFREVLNKRLNRGLIACGNKIKEMTTAGYFIVKKGDKNTNNYFLNTK